MTISPPSDIILEVARAADPAKLAQATGRLREIAQARGHDTEAFGTMVAGLARDTPPLPPQIGRFDADRARVQLTNLQTLGAQALGSGTPPAPRAPAAVDSPARQFEAFVIRDMVETMMPDSDTVFGEGSAGGIWKGFLAEEIGKEIARAGGVGIAEMIAQNNPQFDQVAAAQATLWPEHAGGEPERTDGDRFFTGLFRS